MIPLRTAIGYLRGTMAVWEDVRWLVHLARGRRRYAITALAEPEEIRALAQVMRRLPGRYADRLPPRILRRVGGAAAAGQWEHAVDRLLTALHARSTPVTVAECEELRAVLSALRMPTDRVDMLIVRGDGRAERRTAQAARPAGALTGTSGA